MDAGLGGHARRELLHGRLTCYPEYPRVCWTLSQALTFLARSVTQCIPALAEQLSAPGLRQRNVMNSEANEFAR